MYRLSKKSPAVASNRTHCRFSRQAVNFDSNRYVGFITKKYCIIVPMVASALLSACAQTPAPSVETSGVDTGALYFQNDPINHRPIIDQVAALNDTAAQLVQTSTVNGAFIGAALGCDLTVLSASNARNCLLGAALGGVGGAALGHVFGESAVARHLELVSPDTVVRNIHNASNQFESIQTDLPQLLVRQEADLKSFTMRLLNGQINQAEHDQSVAQIAVERAELAQALTLTARHAKQAAENLKAATSMGQTGLDCHINATTQLADDVELTRSTFSML
jgi:hypothetical protein